MRNRNGYFQIGKSFHNGMTATERVAAGFGTPEDLAASAQQNAQHQKWIQSPEGQAWLKTQSWYKPQPKAENRLQQKHQNTRT